MKNIKAITFSSFLKFWLLLLLTLFLSINEAYAFQLTPISVSIEPHGKKASTFIKVTNEFSTPKAIQITMETREPDQFDDEENNQDAEDNFLVFPPQFILEPNSTRICKISWIGDPSPAKELSYRFIVDELDVNLDENELEQSGVKLLMRYEGALYVKPKNLEGSQIEVKSKELITDNKGNKMLNLTLSNTGDTHHILKGSQLVISSQADPSNKIQLDSKNLKGLEGSNILSGKSRYFQIILPEDFNIIDATVNFRSINK